MAVDITHPAFKADPFPFYARLRSEDPVHRIVLPNKKQAWLITRYGDVVVALKNERLMKDPVRVDGLPSEIERTVLQWRTIGAATSLRSRLAGVDSKAASAPTSLCTAYRTRCNRSTRRIRGRFTSSSG